MKRKSDHTSIDDMIQSAQEGLEISKGRVKAILLGFHSILRDVERNLDHNSSVNPMTYRQIDEQLPELHAEIRHLQATQLVLGTLCILKGE